MDIIKKGKNLNSQYTRKAARFQDRRSDALKFPNTEAFKMIYHIIGRGNGCTGYKGQPGIKWSCNIFRPDTDALFDIHKDAPTSPYIENALKNGLKVYTAANYPLSAISEFFKTDYFGCTIDYMIALAIYLGATLISLWGCNQLKPGIGLDPDLIDHRSILFWCGVCIGRGVRLQIRGNSDLMRLTNGRYQ